MKLSEIITGTQTVELIEPRDSDSHYLRSLRLLLRDNASGALTELTIEADMVAMPDEAVLVWSAMEVDEGQEDRADWWAKGDVVETDDGYDEARDLLLLKAEDEPRWWNYWTITPDGQEIELREGGLF